MQLANVNLHVFVVEPVTCHESPSPLLTLPGVSSLSLECRGSWTVVMRHADSSFDFDRNWDEYKFGFGSIGQDYWLGLFYMFYLTKSRGFYMRVEFWTSDGYFYNAEYKQVIFADETQKFKITINEYLDGGSAADGLKSFSSEQPFSTKGNDATGWAKCVEKKTGGWWYKKVSACQDGKLTGKVDSSAQGMVWRTIRNVAVNPIKALIKIKPTEPETCEYKLYE